MENAGHINGKSVRFPGLDAMKCICAFLVIMIHVDAFYMSETVPVYISAIARVGVPFFFMVTGFFFESLYERRRLKRYCRKILIYLLCGICVFTVLSILFCTKENDVVAHLLKYCVYAYLEFGNIVMFPLLGTHLWYLTALLEAIPLLWLLRRYVPLSCIYVIGFLLLCGNFYLMGMNEFWYYRNALFTGLPYLIFGIFLRNSGNLTVGLFGGVKGWIILLVVSLLAFLLEMRMLGSLSVNIIRDHYYTTPLLSLSLFGIGLNNPFRRLSALVTVGRYYSTHIYIWHTAFVSLLIPYKDKIHYLLLGVIIFALSILLAWFIFKAKNCFRKSAVGNLINIKTVNK